MKKNLLHFLLTGFMLFAFNMAPGQQVIHFIPAPGTHCQDVAWDGSNIWVSDNETQTYYKLNPADGSVLYTIPYPAQAPFSEGMTFQGQDLWTCGWEESNGSFSRFFRFDPDTGELLETIDYPGDVYANWPHDIVFAWGYLWANNFETHTLDKINLSTGEIEGTLPAPGEYSIGIAWDGSYFWTNDFDQDLIYKQDPNTGEIIGSFPMPEFNMRGMTWDGNYLWMVNWQAEKIYQVDVGPLYVAELKENMARIYPNPGNGLFHVKAGAHGIESVRILVADITGKTLKEYFIDPQDGFQNDAEIDLRDLSDGIYLVNISDSGKLFREKIILKR